MKLYKKRRIAFFATILIICTVCIGVTISIQMNKYYEEEIENKETLTNTELYELDQGLFRTKFINSFNNKITGNYEDIQKKEDNKEIIYTVSIQEKNEGKYNLNVNIPVININNKEIDRYNEEIKDIFENKILEIKRGNIQTIYTVDYIANINNNILSLVIKATLKEGENSQRLILKTYNYNLEKGKQIELQELIKAKELKIKEVQEKLKEELEKQNKEAEELKKVGYDVFMRNITEDMFKIENIKTYFIDGEGYLYILYPYGNNNLTTEMDIVVF